MLRPKQNRDCRHESLRLKGFSLIELLIVVAIILIIAAIAVPNFLRARIAANQAAAAQMVRTVTSANVVYSTTYSNGYAPSLAVLGGIALPPSCNGAVLLDPTVSMPPNTKSGYSFAYLAVGATILNPPAGCGAGYQAYLIAAVPVGATTGTNSYCSAEPGTIHYDTTGAPIASQAACEALPVLQ
jgi:type IV pilus assembly protein PilA